VTLCISSIDSNAKKGQLEITGTTGSYVFSGGTWEMTQVRGSETVITKGTNRPCEYVKYYTNVAQHLMGKAKLIITPEWARRPIHIIDLGCKSAEKGTALKAKYR